MPERMLIVKLRRTSATQAELFGPRHKYPDLRCFELALLADAGIDFEGLPVGEEQPCRFWAIWEYSERLNRAGNQYRDLLMVEPMSGPPSTTSAAVGDPAVLGELRAIRGLLTVLVEAQGLQVPEAEEEAEPGELDRAFPRYGDGSPVSDNAAELEAYEAHVKATGQAPADVGSLREWYKEAA